MASQFSDFYRQIATVHETISALARARPGKRLDMIEITQRIRDQHADIGMAPTDLAKAIMTAAKDAGITLRGSRSPSVRGIGNLHLTPPLNVGD